LLFVSCGMIWNAARLFHGRPVLGRGWVAVLVLETILYVVGSAFIGLVLAKERMVRIHQDAASTDELTGLPNRRGFLQAAQALIRRQAQLGQPVTVMMFDLDRFKSVNDRFGHGVGDEALRVFGATASTYLRASDVLGRLGGEEFAAVLPGTVEDAAIAAERVRRAFQVAGVSVAGCLLDATVSIGVASGEPGSEVTAMLAGADAALYRAKINGRNRVELEKDVPDFTVPEPAEPVFEWHVVMPVAQPAA